MTARLRNLRHRELDGIRRRRLRKTAMDMANGDVLGIAASYAFTANNLTDQITVTGEDTLAVGNPRVFVYGTDLPVGLTGETIYYLRDAGTNLYTLHPSKEDAAAGTNTVAFTDDGSGTLTLAFL